MGVTNFDDYKDVFVVADTIDDVVHPVTYELIGQARRIAKELGQLVQVMLLGEHVQSEAEELVAHGADIVHVFESPLLKYYTTDGYTKVLTDFFKDHKPNVILIGATNNGRDLAPRMSGRMQNGVVADCTILTVDTTEGLVEWTRWAATSWRKSFLQTIVHKWAPYVLTYSRDQSVLQIAGVVFKLNNSTLNLKTFA